MNAPALRRDRIFWARGACVQCTHTGKHGLPTRTLEVCSMSRENYMSNVHSTDTWRTLWWRHGNRSDSCKPGPISVGHANDRGRTIHV